MNIAEFKSNKKTNIRSRKQTKSQSHKLQIIVPFVSETFDAETDGSGPGKEI